MTAGQRRFLVWFAVAVGVLAGVSVGYLWFSGETGDGGPGVWPVVAVLGGHALLRAPWRRGGPR